jgi:hypothetical protein
MAERSLPAPSAVADMCAQTAWKTPDENTRQILEYGAETIRALMARCVALARQKEPVERPAPNDQLATVAWEFDVAEGDVICGPDSAIAEINKDDDADGVGEFRTLTIPCVTWFGNDRDAVELRALSGWLTQMADWLEGTR